MNSILDILYEALEPVKDTPGELKAIQDRSEEHTSELQSQR